MRRGRLRMECELNGGGIRRRGGGKTRVALGGKVFARRIYGSQKGRTRGGECQLWTKAIRGRQTDKLGLKKGSELEVRAAETCQWGF